MSVVATRLVFLAFLGLTGFITYNALYLQEQRTQAFMPKVIRGEQAPPAAAPKTVAVTSTTPSVPALPSPPKVSAVTTDLPPRMVAETAVALCDGLGARVLANDPNLTLADARATLAATVGTLVGHDGPLPAGVGTLTGART